MQQVSKSLAHTKLQRDLGFDIIACLLFTPLPFSRSLYLLLLPLLLFTQNNTKGPVPELEQEQQLDIRAHVGLCSTARARASRSSATCSRKPFDESNLWVMICATKCGPLGRMEAATVPSCPNCLLALFPEREASSNVCIRALPRNGQRRRATWTTPISSGVAASMDDLRKIWSILNVLYASGRLRGYIGYNARMLQCF